MRVIDADALIEFCAERWIPLNVDAVNMQPTIQPVATDTNVGDTISRQAAIDALKQKSFRLTFAEEQNYEGHVAWSAEAIYADVAEGTLLELPSAPEWKANKWIPISEKLPEETGEYLVTDRTGRLARYIYYGSDSSKEYWKRCVLAWMPLPEPYGGKG